MAQGLGYRGVYRSRSGVVFGVCQGLADTFDLSAFWLRVATVVGFVATGFVPVVVIYIAAALIMKQEPRYL